jgi:hypothetical protein
LERDEAIEGLLAFSARHALWNAESAGDSRHDIAKAAHPAGLPFGAGIRI